MPKVRAQRGNLSNPTAPWLFVGAWSHRATGKKVVDMDHCAWYKMKEGESLGED